ncbi:MAG: hypothetical protein ACYTGG_03150 [Planctomycetota bacterium]|jgi:hypothetical protein
MSTPNEPFTVELKPRHIEYLQQIADTYDLPDEWKALRALIDFAISSPDDEHHIFGEIRCLDC